MNLQILKAGADQAENLSAIALAAKRHWGYPEAWIQEWAPLLTITAGIITSLDVWYARMDGEVIGFHVLRCAAQRAALEHLWVLPLHMGQGIGRALFEHALRLAHSKGCRVLEIVSDPNAAGFYEKMGAVLVGQHTGKVGGTPRSLPMLELHL